MKSLKWWHLGLVSPLVSALLAEAGLRLAGVTDFPTYETDDTIGYIPAPAQSGAFLNKNRWQLNERSMGSGPWQPDGQRDLVLLGDSIVWGGNPLDQPDKLGPQLQAVSGSRWRVWSAAAGSWSVRNQLAYLDRYPDVEAEADALVWVLNTGDLSAEPSRWHSDSTHPRSRPHSALLYVANKYAAPRLGFSTGGGEPLPATDSSAISTLTASLLSQRLSALAASKQVLVVLYPDINELDAPTDHYLRFKQVLTTAMNGCCALLELRDQPDWKADLYRDSIHPSPQGNRVLAHLIYNTTASD